MKTQKVDIIIVGAGLIGSTLALALAKKFTVALVERSSQTFDNKFPNQRVVALGKRATDMLSGVGVLNSLGAEFCYPYQGMFVWDENSDGELAFTAQDLNIAKGLQGAKGLDLDKPCLGHMIDSVQCTIELQKQIEQQSNIQTFYNAQAQSLSVDGSGGRLTIGDNELSAPLIVAADGAGSWVRKQAKIFVNHRSYQQRGIVAKIKTEHSHQNTAWQRFMSSGPLALLPVSDNQCSIVWSVDNDKASELISLENADFELSLEQAFGNRLGKIDVLTKPVAFPLVSQQAEKYFTRNIVLVGDAAHSIHPLAGQGANLGFKDISVLVELLLSDDVTDLSDIKLLKRYQDYRQSDNQQTDLMMSALHHAYKNSVPAWLSLRSIGMNAINRSELVKSWLAAQASGE